MRNNIILWLLLLLGVIAKGQNQVEFLYDNAGNRTTRQIVTLKSAFINNDKLAISEEKMMKKSIRLFPNPTYGLLTMDISDLDNTEQVNLQVSDMNGRVLIKEIQEYSNFKIDLSSYPKGFYLLTVTIGTERKDWKIVKE